MKEALTCCKRRLQEKSWSAAQQSGKAIDHDVKKAEEHKAFFAFVFTKLNSRDRHVRDQSSQCEQHCGESSSSNCEGTACKVLS